MSCWCCTRLTVPVARRRGPAGRSPARPCRPSRRSSESESQSSQRTPFLDFENASSLPLGSLVSTCIRRRHGQAVLFPEQIPADGGTRHSPGAYNGRGREPGRSVREPDIPVLERNGTGTGDRRRYRDLAANHGGTASSKPSPYPPSFGSQRKSLAGCKNLHATGDGSPQHSQDVRRDARTGWTMNRSGSDAWNLTQ